MKNKTTLFLVFSLLFILVFLNYNLYSYASDKKEINEKLHTNCLYPVIKIIGPSSFGSGTITRSVKIDDNTYLNFFVTCKHIIDNLYKERYFVHVYQYKDWSTIDDYVSYKCYFHTVSENEDCDLATGMFISDKKMYTAELNTDPKFYISNSIFSIGCGLGGIPRMEEGKITAPVADSTTVRASLNILPGDSGSPVFNSDYQIVGIIKSINTYHGQLVFSISFFTSTVHFKELDKVSEGTTSCVWTKEEDWPKLTFYKLKFFRQYEIKK